MVFNVLLGEEVFLEILRVQNARTGLKINVKKTKSLRQGIDEDGEVMSRKERIDPVVNINYLESSISKDGAVKIRKAEKLRSMFLFVFVLFFC